jgi:hypothetical protein
MARRLPASRPKRFVHPLSVVRAAKLWPTRWSTPPWIHRSLISSGTAAAREDQLAVE